MRWGGNIWFYSHAEYERENIESPSRFQPVPLQGGSGNLPAVWLEPWPRWAAGRVHVPDGVSSAGRAVSGLVLWLAGAHLGLGESQLLQKRELLRKELEQNSKLHARFFLSLGPLLTRSHPLNPALYQVPPPAVS